MQKLQGEIHSAKPAKLACFDLEGFNFPGVTHCEHCWSLCSDLFIKTTHFHSPYIVWLNASFQIKFHKTPPHKQTQNTKVHQIIISIISWESSLSHPLTLCVCLYVYSLKRKSRVLFVLCEFLFCFTCFAKRALFYIIPACLIFQVALEPNMFFLRARAREKKYISINNIDSNIENEQSPFFFKSWNLIQNQVIMYWYEHD